MPDINGLPTLPELRSVMEVHISDMVRARFGEPVESNDRCEQCKQDGVEVWATINGSSEWFGLCAKCVALNEGLQVSLSNAP